MTAQEHDLWAAQQFESYRQALAAWGIYVGFRRLLYDDDDEPTEAIEPYERD